MVLSITVEVHVLDQRGDIVLSVIAYGLMGTSGVDGAGSKAASRCLGRSSRQTLARH